MKSILVRCFLNAEDSWTHTYEVLVYEQKELSKLTQKYRNIAQNIE